MCHSHIRLLTLQEETGSERGREVGGWGMGDARGRGWGERWEEEEDQSWLSPSPNRLQLTNCKVKHQETSREEFMQL